MSRQRAGAGRALRFAVLWFLLPAVLVLLAGALVAAAVTEPMADLFRDLSVTADLPLYDGALSSVTVMVWTAGAAIALATAEVRGGWSDERGLLRSLGLLTLVLALDDQFQLHDGVLQLAGLPGELLQVAYVLAVPVLARVYREVFRRRADTVVLLAALALLALSTAVDLLGEEALGESVRVFLEDGSKLLGAALWLAYLVSLSRTVRARPAVDAG